MGGCAASSTRPFGGAFEVPRREGALGPSGRYWYSIGTAHFSNLVQEAIANPDDYVIYDTRPRREFLASTIAGSVWAWELNVPDPQGAKQKKSPSAKPLPLSNPYFLKSLFGESSGKMVLVWGEGQQTSNNRIFLECLAAARVAARLVCVLRRGVRTLKVLRYRHLLGPPAAAPREILPGTLLLAGHEDVANESPQIFLWGVNAVVNMCEKRLRVRTDCELAWISPTMFHGAPPLEKAAATIASYLQRQRVVLVIDDFGGRHWGAAACAAVLIASGVQPDAAVAHVMENMPSADLTFCRFALSLAVSKPYKLPAARAAFRSRSKSSFLPACA